MLQEKYTFWVTRPSFSNKLIFFSLGNAVIRRSFTKERTVLFVLWICFVLGPLGVMLRNVGSNSWKHLQKAEILMNKDQILCCLCGNSVERVERILHHCHQREKFPELRILDAIYEPKPRDFYLFFFTICLDMMHTIYSNIWNSTIVRSLQLQQRMMKPTFPFPWFYQ